MPVYRPGLHSQGAKIVRRGVPAASGLVLPLDVEDDLVIAGGSVLPYLDVPPTHLGLVRGPVLVGDGVLLFGPHLPEHVVLVGVQHLKVEIVFGMRCEGDPDPVPASRPEPVAVLVVLSAHAITLLPVVDLAVYGTRFDYDALVPIGGGVHLRTPVVLGCERQSERIGNGALLSLKKQVACRIFRLIGRQIVDGAYTA